MSTLYSQNAVLVQFNSVGDIYFYSEAEVYFTFPGTVSSFSYTLTGNTVRGLSEVTFDPPLHGAKGFSILTSPQPDNNALAANVSWNDGTEKSATVLAFVDRGNERLFLSAIDGDPLPTSPTDFGDWFENLTISAPSGPFGAGSTFTTADLGLFSIRSGDLFIGTDGDDAPISGGDGFDYFIPTAGRDHFDGGSSTNEILGNRMDVSADPNLVINLKRGFLTWDQGTTTLENVNRAAGTTYDDILKGNDDNNVLNGNPGDDIIRGLAGIDNIYGGTGNDRIFGGDDFDFLYGERDDDVIRGEGGGDTIEGGGGNDIIRGGGDNDTIYGDGAFGVTIFDGDDRVFGQDGDDTIHGGDGDDWLDGGRGVDTIFGNGGNDALRGRNGRDVLEGGAGDDNLYGGDSADTFVFTDIADLGRDRIKDFEDGTDLLDISDFGWDEATLLANLSQQNAHVRLEFGVHTEGTDMRLVIIENTDLADITAADFVGLLAV